MIECLDFLPPTQTDFADQCRVSFRFFTEEFWEQLPGIGSLEWNWHLEVMCDELQTLAHFVYGEMKKPSGKRQRRPYDLICNISPGTSKSSIFSVMFPAWVWTWWPQARFLCASHTDSLVLDLAARSRLVITSAKYKDYFPSVRLRPDHESKGDYANSQGGERKACTVAGKTPTGRHAHFLIADDPLDPKRAASMAELKIASDFFTQTIPSRKLDKRVCPLILVMQRLEPNDPAQVMLDVEKRTGAVPVRKLCLPAELTEDVSPPELKKHYTEYNPHAGCLPEGLMDPSRLGREVLDEQKAVLGSLGYAAQYLQNPQVLDGGLFKIKYFGNHVEAAPYHASRVRYWDLAATPGGGCSTAGTLLSRDDKGNWYFEHVESGQWEPRERNDTIKATAWKDRARYGPGHEPDIVIEHEGGSSGVDAFKYLAAELAGFRVHFDKPRADKVIRAQPLASQFAAGNVYLVADGTWQLSPWIDRMVAFSETAKHKDECDSASGGFNWLLSRPRAGILRVVSAAKKKGLRFIVMPTDDLATTLVEEPCLLVVAQDPPTEAGILQKPANALANLADWLPLPFLDLDPEALKEGWVKPFPPYPETPDKLVLTKEQGKRFWAFLVKKREPAVQTFVFAGDQRAQTLALAAARSFNVAPKEVWQVSGAALSDPPCKRLFELVKSYRSMVV